MWKDIVEQDRDEFNSLVTHPLQSFEWGVFRKKTGVKVIRKGFFENEKLTQIIQLTIHKIPHTKWTIGYFPKSVLPTREIIEELKEIGKQHNCIFIQLEPNVVNTPSAHAQLSLLGLMPSTHPLFTKYTFQLDLTKSENELLKDMSQKTRYNIRVAQKHHVVVKEETSEKAFHEYLRLTEETTSRQGFFAHTRKYHELMWQTLAQSKKNANQLQAHLFVAWYEKQALTTWIVFTFHDNLYYPYGASSSLHREVMSSNLMMWDVITFGKKQNLKLFDMWGSLGPEPDTKDPWYGFHRFKSGYGPQLVEFVGSYDLVLNPIVYQGYRIADKLRWLLLRLKK